MNTHVADMMKWSDAQLIEDYLRGNPLAFNLLMMRCEKKERQFLHYWLHNKDSEDETWRKVVMKVNENIINHRYHEEGHFGTYLNTIVIRKAWDALHAKSNSIEWVADYEVADNSTAEKLFGDDRLQKLWPLIEKMGERTRTIFYMNIVQEMTLTEIAKALNIGVTTVHTLYSRAVTKLKMFVATHQKYFQ